MSYEIEGILNSKSETRVISDKFSVRDCVIEVSKTVGDAVYTDHIKIQFTTKRLALLDAFNVGDVVKVNFNLTGRKTDDGRCFTNIDGWKVESLESGSSQSQPVQIDESNDLPF